jgi:hypothetical protein
MQAPPAIRNGRFNVNDRYAVYGWRARLVGILLLQIPVTGLADMVYWDFIRGRHDWPDWYLPVRVVMFLGSIIVAASICALCRRRRQDVP